MRPVSAMLPRGGSYAGPTGLVGVVGCGTMGSGIAEAAARAGWSVVVNVLDERHAAEGRRRIEASLRRSWEAGRLDAQHVREALGRISFGTDLTSLAGTSLVVEAIPERLADKRALFADLSRACPQSVLCTNTSSLPVIELAVATGSPERVAGLHFFNPAPVMKLVELATTVATSEEARRRARSFAESLDKTVVACRDRAGFIANLLLFPYLNEAVKLLDSGYAKREDIDMAMKLGAGHPMGPLELIDLVGLDACAQILESLAEQFAEPRFAPAPALRQLTTAGFTGRKAGRGFYTYTELEARTDEPAPRASDVQRPEREVRRLGVVGTGTVGAGVSEVAARAGLEVTCWGRSEESIGRARAAVHRSTQKAVEKGKLPAGDRDQLLHRIEYASSLQALAGTDVVVEAVAEDLEVKRSLFAALDRLVKPDAILATATSSLSVIDIAAATARIDRVVGLHFFNPVPAMKLVEVVRTVATSDGALGTAVGLVEQMGKVPVLCRDRAGFIVNRLLFPYLNDAVRMLEEGYASADDIDAAMTLGCNHPVGPLALMDLVGLDVSLQIMRSLHRELLDPGYAPAPLLEHMVRAGFLGRKSDRGFRTV
jgi:3-hydroxybutyryl-CoA dehydrogenase